MRGFEVTNEETGVMREESLRALLRGWRHEGHISFLSMTDRVGDSEESGLGRCMDVFFVALFLSRCD